MPLHGRHLPPQSARTAIWAGVLSSLLEDPAIRLAETTSRPAGTYTGGGLTVQRFLRPAVAPNSPDQLELAPVSMNARRALSRNRGVME